MKLLSALLVASTLVSVSNAACTDVCTCTKPALFNEADFTANVAPKLLEIGQSGTFVKADSESISGCVISLSCDYGDLDDDFSAGQTVFTASGQISEGATNFDDVACVNSKWIYKWEEVVSVGCYKSFANEDY
ncbi:unnamed protein product [Caenorhabditis sp. 36 PRJEB53466]|nr:unnamed protein product [Caenorhabditis sp. 36 PRJEB53466]